jgi:glycosyltransferase involved in cell wall biosynthesis
MKSNAHIAIASTGPYEAELHAHVDSLNIRDRVTFLGYIPDNDLAPLYRLADVFAIPSEADLQSLTTMEAMACGLPVIAADAYALPELVHHESNGFLFQPGDSSEMAHYIDILLENEALRWQMGAASLEIIARHDSLRILLQWEELYRRLSNEFMDARERRQRLRMQRKRPGYKSSETKTHRPRIVRTGELTFDQRD